ncbi:MAG: DNA-directed RNA polymerase subunit beta [Candidatus Terrybacteria bacterium]|nr:DNA-directed RNA polymerase subunit beta [Candidatus Terrybacteria bacterium]
MLKKKYFSKYKEPVISPPHLVKMQFDSFKWFKTEGLKELFEEFSPIHDYTGKEFTLTFTDFFLDEPKYDEYYAKENKLNLQAPLKIKAKLLNKELNQTKEQEIFLADFPIMTNHGTFVINGVERVIISQLARSFGVYFTADVIKGKKYFGAKIIPSRGAWVEIKTEPDNTIYIRVDRKRKIPITSLLRIFGAEKDNEIERHFEKVDKGEISYIKKTLEKDSAKTTEDAYIELYKRLRPGEMASFETSRDFIKTMFDASHYDLSIVGRYKLNHRLGFSLENIKTAPRVLALSDFIGVISKIINLNNTPGSQPDDIDHLGNRRVRTVGELLQQRLRVGMTRMKRNIQDRMSTLDSATLSPSQLINNKLTMTVINDFFSTNPLSQFMSQKNNLDEIEHLRRLTALGPGGLARERAGFEVRDVHSSHYGRICPIETPEGTNIGLVVHLSVYARFNEYGILETPYRRVKNGRITSEIVYLNALDELNYNIAHAGINYNSKTGEILDKEIEARVYSRPGLVAREKVDFIDVSTNQAFGVATSMIPFLENDDATRALMGANMQKQAVPCIKPQAPLVATGMEVQAIRDSGRVVISEEDGVVEYVDASKIIIGPAVSGVKGKGKKTYNLLSFLRSNDFTTIHQRPSVSIGDKVSKGDVIADNYSSADGQMALGQNLLVAFLSWRGANFEDAIIISERLVREDVFTSAHTEEFSVNVRDTKLGPEVNTYDIPNVGENKLKDLDEDGIVRIGAEVRADDILVGKISPKGEAELTPEERLLRSIFGEKARDVKDTSLRLDHGKQGRVIGVKIFSRDQGDVLEPGITKKIFIEIAQLRKISVGDKLAGRHGNKGVISKILAVEDMPYLEDGTPVDIILNPLGVASRMNLGQILETHLGWAAEKLRYQAITPILSGATENEIKEEMKKAGIPEDGKVKLFDGRTGESFDQKVTVGKIYIMKLDHMAEDKIHMRSIGPYSLITQQPLKGKAQGGGQRFGEMEVWALEGYGAAHALQEMLTIKSDDIIGRAAVYNSIIRGEKFKSPHLPASFHVLLNELKGLALDVELKGIIEKSEARSTKS